MKKLLSILISIALMASVFIYTNPYVFADTAQGEVCTAIGGVSGGIGCNTSPTNPGPTVYSLVAAIINILSFVVGIVGIVMIIVGAMKYMTSGGDANAVASAKKTLLYALVGLVLAVMSQALVHYVLNKAAH